ncbi:Uncharacterized protein FWK35_00004592 [Aphis craccivora]|uniref:Uncharacterized protein n=1 Tax=Aphis craccivora TaxID=307492 RepID=A0A6G0ZKC2_APHCR|nr:Uncharacterized protein FWK35_00004592 [Aphis craccivora]
MLYIIRVRRIIRETPVQVQSPKSLWHRLSSSAAAEAVDDDDDDAAAKRIFSKMKNTEKNKVHSYWHTFKMIYLTFCVVILMAKTATGISQNFTTSISKNGTQKIVSTFPMNDLLPLPGTPNSIYHEAIKTCSKVTQFMIDLYFEDPKLLRPPPLVAASMNRYWKNNGGVKFKGTSILVNLTNPLKFTMCSDHVSLLQLYFTR